MSKLNKKIIIYIIVVIAFFGLICGIALYTRKKTTMNNDIIETLDESNDEINEEENAVDVENIQDEVDVENIQDEEVSNENNEKQNKTVTYNGNYFIRVNYLANVVTIYKKSDSDEYLPIKAMICSTGTWTPKSGKYKTSDKYVWGYLNGGVWGQYCTRITGSILFHSVPYFAKDKGTLEYLEYDKLGTTASQGCVRLTVADANWIYNNIPKGTEVEFYSDSNAGPLGKPSARKISNESDEYRNWDPTDPDDNNPWKHWKNPNEDEKVESDSENVQQDITKKENENNEYNNENNIIIVENKEEKEDINPSDEKKEDINLGDEKKEDSNTGKEEKEDINQNEKKKEDINSGDEEKEDINSGDEEKEDINTGNEEKEDINPSDEKKEDINSGDEEKEEMDSN